MVLDDKVVHFLMSTEPLYIHLAAANSEGHPFSVRCFGVKAFGKKDMIGIYILKAQTEKVHSYIKKGDGVIACLFTDGFSNESYQIKGRFVEVKAVLDKEDLEILTRYRNGSLKLFPKMYAKYPLSTALCNLLTYRVEEVFIQTPGPFAGNKYSWER